MSTDAQYRLAVGAGGAVLVAVITFARFCGGLSLRDPKPPEPVGPSGTARQLLAKSTSSTPIYLDYIAKDAAAASVRAPTLDDMSRKLAYYADDARHVLDVGGKPVETVGLRLTAERSNDLLVLSIENTTDHDLAYEVTTTPASPGVCNSARPLPFDAMVIAKKSTEARTECVWREGASIAIARVETMEVPPLSSWYLRQLPPGLVGIPPRIARGHRRPANAPRCSEVVAQTIRSGIERREIGWRDLVDFYARHRCETYQFPPAYRAFNSDGEQALPALDESR